MATEEENGWNCANEDVIKRMGESCQGYKLMHFYSTKFYSLLYTTLMYINLIVIPIIGTISTIDSILNLSSRQFSIIIAILSYITTILTAIIKFGKFNEKYESHKVAASKYASIETNIRNQLGLFRKDRVEGKDYLSWITKSADDLIQASPFIQNFIYKKYYNISKNYNLTFPDRYNKFVITNKGEPKQFTENIFCDDDIKINIDEEEIDSKPIDSKPIDNDFKSKVEINPRRNSIYTPIPDFNRYSESQMKYEMKRFMGF